MNATETERLVVFRVGDRDFALRVDDVSEILRMVAFNPLPEAPPWVLGLMNVRGRVVPVIDLAGRLGLPMTEPEIDDRILLVRRGNALAGGVAREVRASLEVADEMSTVGDLAGGPGPSSVRGIARIGDDLVALLDVEQVFGEVLDQVAPEGPT